MYVIVGFSYKATALLPYPSIEKTVHSKRPAQSQQHAWQTNDPLPQTFTIHMYVLGMWHARMKIFLQIPEGDFNGYNSNFSLFTLIYTRIPTVILIYHWPHENGFPDDSPEVVPRDDPVSEHQRRPKDGSGWTNQTRYTNQQQVETTVAKRNISW